ncbi:MAG: EamA family transporter [Roseiflexaceae bacterium]|jgi:drug/metabolite transporter (DMT)-like permease
MSLFILTALSASLLFGIGDFIGGRASSKMPVVQVLVVGQLVGVLMYWGLAWYNNEAPMPSELFGLALLAGVTGALGLAGLYYGIARGFTAVTAPVSAVLAAIIPVLYGLQTQGLPSTLALAGMGVGVVAIVLNSLAGRANGYQGLWQGIVAGVAIGVFLILLKYIGSAGVFTPLAMARSGALLITIPWLLIRPGGRPNSVGVGLAAVAGLLDLLANTAYMMSTQMGRLDIASVLASLYPAVTVLLAFFINSEKINLLQRIGLVATIVATALIAL